MRIARLEKQAITKTEAYEALRDFMVQHRTNTRMIVEIGGYLQVLKDGGDLSDRDLKVIRKMMHRNNASDLADSFRSNPTGRQPPSRVIKPQRPPQTTPQIPRSLKSFATKLRKEIKSYFKKPTMVSLTKKFDKIRKWQQTGDKEFYQTIIQLKGQQYSIVVVEPLDGNYSNMPTFENVFFKGKEDQLKAYLKKTYEKSGLLIDFPPTIKEIIHFLKEEAKTATGGGFHSLLMYRGNTTYWEFQMEPGDRQRQDHWHFTMSNYDHEEDDRQDAWSDWEWSWANPLQEQTTQALRDKFPILADNREWGVMVGEKGHVEFQFPKDLIPED